MILNWTYSMRNFLSTFFSGLTRWIFYYEKNPFVPELFSFLSAQNWLKKLDLIFINYRSISSPILFFFLFNSTPSTEKTFFFCIMILAISNIGSRFSCLRSAPTFFTLLHAKKVSSWSLVTNILLLSTYWISRRWEFCFEQKFVLMGVLENQFYLFSCHL